MTRNRHPAVYAGCLRIGAQILKRNQGLPQAIKDIAWKAQIRLCARHRRLVNAGKPSNVANVAIARELAAFIWAIATSGECAPQPA
jgi:transposase